MPRFTFELLERLRELAAAAVFELPDPAARAARELATLRDSLRPLDLAMVDLLLRDRSSDVADWHRIGPAALKRLPSLPFAGAVIQVLACHPSGHVREEAIRQLAAVSDGREIAVLLLRANDWVAPVRRAAIAALRRRAQPALVPELVQALPLLDRMRAWQRIDDPTLLDELDAALDAAALGNGLASADVLVRRACARRLAATAPGPAAIDLALGDRDGVTRRTIARWLCAEAGPTFDAHATRLLADRLGSVRREALAVAVGRGLSADSAETFLADPDPGVRDIARAHLVAIGMDVAARYRVMLDDGSVPVRAIGLTGLAETEGIVAAGLVRAHLADPDPRLRAAALASAANARLPDLLDVLVAALGDASGGPRRVARRFLIPSAARLRPAALWSVFTAAPQGQARRGALVVLARCDFWPRLSYLLRATADPDPEIAELARQYVASWVARRSRVFTSPAASDADAIRDALSGAQIDASAARSVATAVATPATSSS